MPASAAQDDYDSPWKEAVEHAFPEFIDFYFPDAGRQIDWARGHRFLDKELQQIVRDAALGRRHVDKLASVTTHAGGRTGCGFCRGPGKHGPRLRTPDVRL